MRSLFSSIRRFLSELRRRNVYRVAVTYVVVGFFVIEGADLVLTRLGLPGWTVTLVIVLVGLGFPIALVLAWALEMTPEGMRVDETAPEGGVSRPTSRARDLWVGASVLALLLVGAWWLWGGVGGREATDQVPEIEERSVAVLPFEVSGSGAEEWRDGMVTMLSMNLDGAAGLRAIADRRIFAAAEQVDSTQVGAGRSPALAVARQAGAKYAIVGSAVQLGEELRMGAEIREVASGEILGEVEVKGRPGTITALTDRLTREVLGVLLERSKEQIPSVDLASVTTESLPALKAYLEGERHLRAGEYEAAAEDFERAVQQDSSFALAYGRLGVARDWLAEPEARSRALRRAYERSGQLPERERRILRAQHLESQGRVRAAAERLRRLTEDYPDDPTVWYYLGEKLYHGSFPFNGGVPRGLPEAEEAFQRAVELDPGLASYHHHLVGSAFNFHRDSALAAKRIRAHPAGPINQMHQLARDLIFGAGKKREEALARVERISFPGGNPMLFFAVLDFSLRHPIDGALQEKVLLRLKGREDLEGAEAKFINPFLVMNSFERGQVEKATTQLRELELKAPHPSCLPAWSESVGIGVPDSTLRARLEPSRIEEGASARQLMCAGLYVVEKGRGEELPALIGRLEEAGAEQGLSTGEVRRWAQELKGRRALKARDLKQAERLLGGHNESGYWGAIWRGDLYRKRGRPKTAGGWYLAGWWHPLTHERLGQLYEKMGKPEKARAAYERFVQAWTDTDPKLQDRVTEARDRLEALNEKVAAE